MCLQYSALRCILRCPLQGLTCTAGRRARLQEDVEDVGVRLLDLVQQDDREGAAAHGLRELAALVVAQVARRRAPISLATVCRSMYSLMSRRIMALRSPKYCSASTCTAIALSSGVHTGS